MMAQHSSAPASLMVQCSGGGEEEAVDVGWSVLSSASWSFSRGGRCCVEMERAMDGAEVTGCGTRPWG